MRAQQKICHDVFSLVFLLSNSQVLDLVPPIHQLMPSMSTAVESTHSSQEDSGQEFRYRSLDLQCDSIRLVRVLPTRSQQDCIMLDIWHSTLPARYYCVSYEWGPLQRQRSILLNGKTLAVGENLHAFLQEVQLWVLDGFDEPLWIDAICIDQSCVVERGHQVQRMGMIYSKAQEVLVWLGDHGDPVGAFHDWLHTAHDYQCPTNLRHYWDTIRFNTYWRRAWIRQEILLAKKVTVVMRGAQVDWTILGCAIARSGDLGRLDDEHAAHIWTFWEERWKKSRSDYHTAHSHRSDLFTFWSLMHMHRNACCTDRRDRVYSLLGLIDQDHKFSVNYEESVADLFWRVSEYFNVGDSPELVDILKVALLDDTPSSDLMDTGARTISDPWKLAQSVLNKPSTHIHIPIRRVTQTNSIICRARRSVKCKLTSCRQAPRLQCTRDDLMLCTNMRSDEPTQHGCIHAIAHPLDKPAAEPFEIRLVAHHHKQIATTTLPSTAVKSFDPGTEQWFGISTWSSLQAALIRSDLDRKERVKLSVPGAYAMMIWFGIHPNHLDEERFLQSSGLPSAHHALPSGSKITKDAVELPGV